MPTNTWYRFRGLLSSSVRMLLRKRHKKRGITPIHGIPEGISYETINECCRVYLNEPLRKVSYRHLSGWKQSGAYRLLLETLNGQQWSLIYKNAYYSLENIPALKRLPVVPGPPEYLVYKCSGESLTRYLPQVYFASEIIPGKHYQYLLEDLSENFSVVRKRREIFAAATKLPEIHAAMQGWAANIDQDRLICYDLKFSSSLWEYAREILERYVEITSSEVGKIVCQLWHQISMLYTSFEEAVRLPALAPIHGDLNITNIHVSKNDSDEVKLVDWEWAGLGSPYMDLASLLKRAAPEIEQRALDFYAKNDSSLSSVEQQRLYARCQLERGILDAAFIAVQYLEAQTASQFNLGKFVEMSLQQVLTAYRKLVS